MADFSKDDVRSLSEKLQGLDLSEGEASALEAVLAAGEAAAEVEGYGLNVKDDVHPFGPSRLISITFRPRPSQVVVNHEEQF